MIEGDSKEGWAIRMKVRVSEQWTMSYSNEREGIQMFAKGF